MAQIAPNARYKLVTSARPADSFLRARGMRPVSSAEIRGPGAEIDDVPAVPRCALFPRHDGTGTHASKPVAGAGPAAFAPPGRGAHDRRGNAAGPAPATGLGACVPA